MMVKKYSLYGASISELGGLEMMQTKVEKRVTRENNVLVKEVSN